MLKGVNRQVLEITNPESPYFEKIIFFVRREGVSANEKELEREAQNVAKKMRRPPKTRKTPREKAETAMCIVLGIGAGAALSAIMGVIV